MWRRLDFPALRFLPALLQLQVQMAERGELAGEFGVARSLQFMTRRKVAAAKKVGRRYDRHAHWPVLIGTLRPSEIAVYPKIKAHNLRYNTVGQDFDRFQ